jgi:hypothetical protein
MLLQLRQIFVRREPGYLCLADLRLAQQRPNFLVFTSRGGPQVASFLLRVLRVAWIPDSWP